MSTLYHTAPNYETKSRLHLGVAGKIVQWHDERGFGWVQTDVLKETIFFHANSVVAREHIPQLNESITIHAKYDEQEKRWTATKITSPQREQWAQERQALEQALIRPHRTSLEWAMVVAGVWLVFLTWEMMWLGVACLLVSLLTMAMYALDKRAAIQQGSRIPEMNLHALALLGGWAGALVARYLFSHKTSKQPFVRIFWGTVVVNVVGTVYLIKTGILNIPL